jgi:hypothetical protein
VEALGDINFEVAYLQGTVSMVIILRAGEETCPIRAPELHALVVRIQDPPIRGMQRVLDRRRRSRLDIDERRG